MSKTLSVKFYEENKDYKKKKKISKEVKKPGAQYDCECWKSI